MSELSPLLEVSSMSKRFGAVVALRSADLSVRPGEVHALMGANGAGKSTLVKVLTGVLRPDGGTIALRGNVRVIGSPAAARRAGLMPVYQDPALIPDLTVLQNLRLSGTRVEAVRDWLSELKMSAIDFGALARDLPAPSLRLLDLARALAAEPDVLLLDEITAALPADLTTRVFDVVGRRRQEGRSVIFISHRLAEVSVFCDRATVLRDGETVGVVEPARGAEAKIVDLMLGPVAADVARAEAQRVPLKSGDGRGQSRLEVRNLRAGGMLQDVSFTVRPGEVVGVAALEGQGQRELFDCLAGVRKPDAGQILVEGRATSFRHPFDAIRAGLVLVPADRMQALLRQRSVRENIALPLVSRLTRWGLINARSERRRGNQQKVSIARWLAAGFQTLLCFDPTRGIDIGTKRQIYVLVRELAAAGSSILLFTSELAEIPLACDRVIVLFGGRVVQELPAKIADESTLLRAAHGLAAEAAS